MSYTYSDRKRIEHAPSQSRSSPQQPSMDALRTGAAQPTAEQMGHRVDLPDAMRSKMENAFGADLSAVKLYESQAVEDAGAKAITQGASIAFAPGLLDFTSFGGQALLGHEMSHVVSQARGEVTGGGFLNDASLEARADREGAMAAAGQTVAMPTAAMSGVSADGAAGPMQAKDKDKKPRPGAAAAPSQFSLTGATGLKESGFGGPGSSVMKVQGAEGQEGVLKTGVDASLEAAMAGFYNQAGETYDEKLGGMWGFRAPNVRALNASEQKEAETAVGDQVLHSTTPGTSVTDEVKNMAVFGMAGGKSRIDPNDPDADEQLAKQGESAITANPADAKENGDYMRMMGYISMMDMVTGNMDRLAGRINMGNWLEDRDTRQVNLIDNDFAFESGLRHGISGRKDWLHRLMNYGGKGDRRNSGSFIRNITHEDAVSERLFGLDPDEKAAHSREGVDQAIKDLPGMRDRLKAQFYQANGGQKLNSHQEEILERMQITHEYMTSKEMAEIYEQLAKIGFAPEKEVDDKGNETGKLKQESEDVKRDRARLLAQRDALRYGTGITAGEKPTAASGEGWTRGSAADWMAAGKKKKKDLNLSLD